MNVILVFKRVHTNMYLTLNLKSFTTYPEFKTIYILFINNIQL